MKTFKFIFAKILIVFLCINFCGSVYFGVKYFKMEARNPAIYEVTLSDGTVYILKDDSFKIHYKTNSAELNLDDGSIMVVTNDYNYKLLNCDDVKRWRNKQAPYGLIFVGCLAAWMGTLLAFV